MKNKILRSVVGGLVAATMLGSVIKPSLADECGFNVSLTQRSNDRVDSGTTSIKTPVTELFTGISCGNFDAFVWGKHNNDTGKINEVDVGIGYSFSNGKNGNFGGRIGLTRWMYEENGGKNDLVNLSVHYNGLPVDLGLGVTKLLDDKGTEIIGSVSKKFGIGKIDDVDFTLTPSVTGAYLNNYFELSGYSNTVLGVSLGVNKGNFGVDFDVDQHIGNLKGLGNDIVLSATLRYNF